MQADRIRYGSLLEIDFQLVSWGVSWALAATPTILAILRGLGQARLNFAHASESNANRDLLRERAESTRSERKSREYSEKLDQLQNVVDNLRPRLDENEQRAADFLVAQALLRPELLQDSIDALFGMSEEVLRFQEVSSTMTGDDDLPRANA